VGEAFTAGSMFNLAACVAGFMGGFVPPTTGFEDGGVDFPLRICKDATHRQPVNLALANAMAFGGNHTAVLLRNSNH
jgi:3-oxoacyl-(acyl-carrier-protein) synthase